MRRSIVGLLIVVLLAVEFAVAAKEDTDNTTVYIGGTANVQQGKISILDVQDENVLKFADWQTPYSKITALAYGQHARNNWDYLMLSVVGIPYGITYGIAPALLIKSKDHYLSIAYTDVDGEPQFAIFKVGKKPVKTVLKALETRSGKKIQYEIGEAGKNQQQAIGNGPPILSDQESSSRQPRKFTRSQKTSQKAPDTDTSPSP